MSIINNFEQNQEYTPLDSALSRYLCLIDSSTTSTDVLDAALGKNNEEDTYKVGLALAQYSKYLDASVDIKNDFPILTQCDNILDIIKKQARAEITKNINIYEKLNSSPYATEKLKKYMPFTDNNGVYVVNGIAGDTTTVIVLSNNSTTYTFSTPLSVPLDGYYTLKAGIAPYLAPYADASTWNFYCLLANGEKILVKDWSWAKTSSDSDSALYNCSTKIYMTQQNPITGVEVQVSETESGDDIIRVWKCDVFYVCFTTKNDVLKKGFSFLEGNNISFVITTTVEGKTGIETTFVLPADGAITIGMGGEYPGNSSPSYSLKINDTKLAQGEKSSTYDEVSTTGKKGDIVTYNVLRTQGSLCMLIRSAEFPVTF